MDDDAGRFGARRYAGVVAGIRRHRVTYEQQILQSVLTRFDRHFASGQRRHNRRFPVETRLLGDLLVRMLLVRLEVLAVRTSAAAEYLHSFVPGEVCRRFGHVFGHARQADVASAADVHLRTSVYECLRY